MHSAPHPRHLLRDTSHALNCGSLFRFFLPPIPTFDQRDNEETQEDACGEYALEEELDLDDALVLANAFYQLLPHLILIRGVVSPFIMPKTDLSRVHRRICDVRWCSRQVVEHGNRITTDFCHCFIYSERARFERHCCRTQIDALQAVRGEERLMLREYGCRG